MKIPHPDIVVGALSLIFGLVLLFWLIPHYVEPDPDLRLPVGLVPQVVAIGFMLCGFALLVKRIALLRRQIESEDSGFDQGELRGLVLMIVIMLSATIGFQYLHFLIVAPFIVAVSMWIFGPIRPVSLVLTSTIGPITIWILGTVVLGRVLP